MEAKHTKSPWTISPRPKEKNRTGSYGIDIDAPSMGIINIITVWAGPDDTPNSDTEAEANAKLIAAAPDMLEALKTAKEFIYYAANAKLNLFSDKMQLMYQAQAEIDEAVKKATE